MSICCQLTAMGQRTHGLEGVASRGDEKDAAVDARVGDEALAHGGELLAEVRRVLVLDVLDDRLPAVVVVDKVAVAGGVDDVKLEADAVLNDGYSEHRAGANARTARPRPRRRTSATSLLTLALNVDLGRGACAKVRLGAALRVDEVRREERVDEGRLAKTGLAWEVSNPSSVFPSLPPPSSSPRAPPPPPDAYAPTTMTLNWKPRFRSLCSIWRVMAVCEQSKTRLGRHRAGGRG